MSGDSICPFSGKICNQPKILSIIEVINGQKIEMRACSECAVSLQANEIFILSNPIEFKLDDSLHEDIRCECGLTFMGLAKQGKLGCAMCYKTFADFLNPVIKRCQKAIKHVGRIPPLQRRDKDIKNLEIEMKDAISKEDYERAAEIRDKMKKLKSR